MLRKTAGAHRWIGIFCMMLMLMFLNACRIAPQEDAGEALTNAMESLRKLSYFSYSGQAMVSLSGYNLPLDHVDEGYAAQGHIYTQKGNKWFANPLQKLEQLNALNKKVSWNMEMSKESDRVLEIELNDSDVLEQIISELRAQQNKLALDLYGQSSGMAAPGGPTEQQKELQLVLERSNAELDEMLSTLKANCTYHLWLQPRTGLPQKMVMETRLLYSLYGEPKEELKTMTYVFRDFNIPRETGS